MNSSPPHASPEALIAHSLGMLDEVAGARLEDHLVECDACRHSQATLAKSMAAWPDGQHLPPSMIADWEGAAERLRGVERATVRDHLAACAQCRNLLETLGLTPELPAVTHLEDADPEWLQARIPARAAKPVPGPRPSIGGWVFGAGGWLTAAAAILIAVLRPATFERESGAGPTIPSMTSPAPVEPAPATSDHAPSTPLAAHAELIPVRRGMDDSAGVPESDAARVGPRTGWITVGFPEGLWDEAHDRVLDAWILGPRGDTLYSATMTVGDAVRQELHWSISSTQPPSGTYRLRCRVHGGDEKPRVYEGRFSVRVPTP